MESMLDTMSSVLYSVPMLLTHQSPNSQRGHTVDNEIRLLRTELGWSQSELARRLTVSRQTVNAIENGRYDPSLPLAFKIARAFGRPIEAIFTEDTPEESNAETKGRPDA